MRIAVAASALSKTYRAGILGCQSRVLALRGLDLAVMEGDCVAVAGRSGAGKTTLLLCLAGLLRPDRGRVTWAGGYVGPDPPPGVIYLASPGGIAARAKTGVALALVDDPLREQHGTSREAAFEQLQALRAAGTTIVLSVATPGEVDGLANRIVVLADGRVAATLDPADPGTRSLSLDARFLDVIAMHRRVAEPAP